MYAPNAPTENWPANCPYPPQNYPIQPVYVPPAPPPQGYALVYPSQQQGYFAQQGLPPPNFVAHPINPESSYPSTLPPPEQHVADAIINAKGFAFNDASIRRNFIRKVYGLLSVNISTFQ